MPPWARWGTFCGLVASIPLWAGVISLAVAGWAPVGDEAVIAWRSWDVLGTHGPLVGQFTQASGQSSQAVFDPGPLLYWVLAVPTHLFPRIGPLLAVAALDTVALAVTAAAVGHVRGRLASVIAALLSLLCCWSLLGVVLGMPIWNPFSALVPFFAVLVVAWAVASGRLGWWPALVAGASFCTQTHLMYAPASVGLVVIAPAVGVFAWRRRHRRLRWRWAVTGAVVLLACWAAPVWQELTGDPGNLTLLRKSVLGSQAPTLGWSTALGGLGSVTLPDPRWLRPPTFHSNSHVAAAAGSSIWGVIVLLALAGVATWAGWRDRPRPLALAVVALVADLGACWAIAGITRPQQASAAYIQYVLWPVGLLSIAALAYPIATVAYPWLRDRSAAQHGRARGPWVLRRSDQRTALATGLGAVLVVAAMASAGLAAGNAPEAAQLGPGQLERKVTVAATALVHAAGSPPHAGQRLTVRTDFADGFAGIATTMAAAYRLQQRGWVPTVETPWNLVLSGRYHRRPTDPSIWLTPERPAPDAMARGTVLAPSDGGAVNATIWLDPALAPPSP